MITISSQAQLSHEMKSNPVTILQYQMQTLIQQNEEQHMHYDAKLVALHA